MSYKSRTRSRRNCIWETATRAHSVALSTMAECLKSACLAKLLDKDDTNLILIDCRPSLGTNTGMIRGAHQVHCPSIVKRRSGGNIPLDNILRDIPTRTRVMDGTYTHIVIYDEQTTCLADLAKDSNMFLVVKTLAEDKAVRRIYFLHGGFSHFYASFSHLCTSHTMTTPVPTMPPLPHLSNQFLPISSSHLLRDSKLHGAKHTKADQKPAEVLPWLYIGNLEHARQSDSLLELGMSALINMAASTESSPLPSPHFLYKNIPVRDSVTADIIQWFPEIICFIEKVRTARGKVLVHCQAGISRSATICIAYLMYHKDISLEDAFDYLKAKRSVISPNLNFMRQLSEFESELRLQNISRNGEVSPSIALSILQEKVTPSKGNLTLPLASCMHQSPFAFDLPFMPQVSSTVSPLVPLPSPLMSPS